MKSIDQKMILAVAMSNVNMAKKVLWVLARHAFLVMVSAILIEILLGQFLFYRYAFAPQNTEVPILAPATFNQAVYQGVINKASQKQRVLDQALGKTYGNPFQ